MKVVDGASGEAVAGAAIEGELTDADGLATLVYESPGLRTPKATRADSVRSNAASVCIYEPGTEPCPSISNRPASPPPPAEETGPLETEAPVTRITRPRDGIRYRRGPLRIRGGVRELGSGIDHTELALLHRRDGRCSLLVARACALRPRRLRQARLVPCRQHPGMELSAATAARAGPLRGPGAIGGRGRQHRPGRSGQVRRPQTSMIPSTVRIAPPATSPAASSRLAHRRTRPLGPSAGIRATSAASSATPAAIAPKLTRTALVGAGADGDDEEGRAGDRRDRDRYERRAAAGQRGLRLRRSPEQVADAGEPGHDPGGDTERGVADVECVEQRVGQRSGRARRRARRSHRPPRTPRGRSRGVRSARGTANAARAGLSASTSDEGPQPARRRVIAGVGRALQALRLRDRNGPQQPGECVLLVVHPGLAVGGTTRPPPARAARRRRRPRHRTALQRVSPATQRARSATGSRRPDSRGSARAASHQPVSASLITP